VNKDELTELDATDRYNIISDSEEYNVMKDMI
jgi:hypothetical protein